MTVVSIGVTQSHRSRRLCVELWRGIQEAQDIQSVIKPRIGSVLELEQQSHRFAWQQGAAQISVRKRRCRVQKLRACQASDRGIAESSSVSRQHAGRIDQAGIE